VENHATLTDELLERYQRKGRRIRAVQITVAAWAVALVLFVLFHDAIVAVIVLGGILVGGFAWDLWRAARLIESVTAVKRDHPDWSTDQVAAELLARRRR
jgi:hypothetical protein